MAATAAPAPVNYFADRPDAFIGGMYNLRNIAARELGPAAGCAHGIRLDSPCRDCWYGGSVFLDPTSDLPDLVDVDVTAEDAPLGVLLWPVRDAKYAPNFTLAEVHVSRASDNRRWVRWVYQNGSHRDFTPGERVACRVTAADFTRIAQA
jgi:hypothetical protein